MQFIWQKTYVHKHIIFQRKEYEFSKWCKISNLSQDIQLLCTFLILCRIVLEAVWIHYCLLVSSVDSGSFWFQAGGATRSLYLQITWDCTLVCQYINLLIIKTSRKLWISDLGKYFFSIIALFFVLIKKNNQRLLCSIKKT